MRVSHPSCFNLPSLHLSEVFLTLPLADLAGNSDQCGLDFVISNLTQYNEPILSKKQ